jgi:hypothetical protein
VSNDELMKRLGFTIDGPENAVRVLTYNDGGCRPAEDEECLIWDMLCASPDATAIRNAALEGAAYAIKVACKNAYYLMDAEECIDIVVALQSTTLADHIPDIGNMVPNNYVLVPVEPTGEMLNALCDKAANGYVLEGYRAMISAAPKPKKDK